MSIRTEWARVTSLAIEVVHDYEDEYGSSLDPGGIALLLSADNVLAIEAADVDELLILAARITAACEATKQAAVAS